MKRILIALSALTIMSFIPSNNELSSKEREDASKFLKNAEEKIAKEVSGLSEAQLTFKPAADKWSVEDCIKHIAATESALFQMVEGQLKQEANPDKRTEIKWSDEQVMKFIEDRTEKRKTFPQFEPQNITFKTSEEALKSFKENRAKLVEFVNTTKEDLRNHVAALPFGSLDCYQMILFIGAHGNRHTLQMQEIKADPNFPKK